MRKKIIAGNWKMNMDLVSGTRLVSDITEKLNNIQKCDVVFCPPFPLLWAIHQIIQDTEFGLGAQNIRWEDQGAYTGEVSADMLLSVGCDYVIIGHSERRKYFHETDDEVNRKVKKALEKSLIPIVCIGETLEDREANNTEDVIHRQLKGGLEGLSKEQINEIILAYEPVWAIGTGRHATPEQAVKVHQYIRGLLSQWFDDKIAETVRIQYGGSVKESNAEDLLGQPDIDGALVGGASLKVDGFTAIIRIGEQMD